MKLIDKDALLAEIDKRMEHLTPHSGQGVILTKVLKDHYEDLRNFINRMSEESTSKDLEEEIAKYFKGWYNDCEYKDACKIASHFANWQKEQDMKKIKDILWKVNIDADDYFEQMNDCYDTLCEMVKNY